MELDANEWWMVLTNGEWFVGKKKDGKLTSLQKLHTGVGVEANERGLPRPKIASLTYPWFVNELVIPEGALWICVGATTEAKGLMQLIANTEQLKMEQRAARAGIRLV